MTTHSWRLCAQMPTRLPARPPRALFPERRVRRAVALVRDDERLALRERPRRPPQVGADGFFEERQLVRPACIGPDHRHNDSAPAAARPSGHAACPWRWTDTNRSAFTWNNRQGPWTEPAQPRTSLIRAQTISTDRSWTIR